MWSAGQAGQRGEEEEQGEGTVWETATEEPLGTGQETGRDTEMDGGRARPRDKDARDRQGEEGGGEVRGGGGQ